MRRRLVATTALLALLLALAVPAARAQERFIVFFSEWSAELDAAAQDVVAAAAGYARQHPALGVQVLGYASTDGSPRANLYLSLLRAQLVSDRLVANGVDPARVTPIGEGAVASVGTTEEARRVEIVLRPR